MEITYMYLKPLFEKWIIQKSKSEKKCLLKILKADIIALVKRVMQPPAFYYYGQGGSLAI